MTEDQINVKLPSGQGLAASSRNGGGGGGQPCWSSLVLLGGRFSGVAEKSLCG